MPLRSLIVVSVALSLTSCRPSDSGRPRAQTEFRLGLWAQSIQTAHEMGINVEKYRTADDALSDFRELQIVDADSPLMEPEPWGRHFIWQVKRVEKELVVTVTFTERSRDHSLDEESHV